MKNGYRKAFIKILCDAPFYCFRDIIADTQENQDRKHGGIAVYIRNQFVGLKLVIKPVMIKTGDNKLFKKDCGQGSSML